MALWIHFLLYALLSLTCSGFTEPFESSTINKRCGIHDIFNGDWQYHNYVNGSTSPYKSCPLTLRNVKLDSILQDQPEKYSCDKTSYLEAHYKPRGCQVASLKKTLMFIDDNGRKNPRKSKLVLIGDSMMGQVYISILCFAEEHKINTTNIHYMHDLFLRHDIPCDDRCIHNATFRNQDIFFHPCWNCHDGIRRNFSDFMVDPVVWHKRLPPDTGYLLFSVGAWYNAFQGLLNSTEKFIETLSVVTPLLRNYQDNLGWKIAWLDLPPVIYLVNIGRFVVNPDYEWQVFDSKNKIANEMLSSQGLRFLNTSSVILPRLQRDPNINAEGIHWCSPGKYAVPTFLIQIALHLLIFGK